MDNIEREEINSVDYLHITVVKTGDKVKRYEIRPVYEEGFYRISTDTTETGVLFFPGRMNPEEILSDIRKAKEE